MDKLENKLQEMFKTVQKSHTELRKYNENLRNLYNRLEEISVQYKRKMPLSDTSFEKDFCALIEKIRVLSDENYEFWGEIRKQYLIEYEKKLKKFDFTP